MPLERISLEARLRELEDRVINLESQEKMGLTGQVSGSYNLYEEIDGTDSDETIRMTFGLYDAVDEDGAPTAEEFGFDIRTAAGEDLFEINDTGLVMPGQPMNITNGQSLPTVTTAAWTATWMGCNYTAMYDAVRFSVAYNNSAGSTQFRLKNNVGTPTYSSSSGALSGAGTVDFRWKHGQNTGTGPGPNIILQAWKTGGTGTCTIATPYIAHFVGSEKIGATTAGI